MADRQRPALHLPGAGGRRATVIGAGSFGTAVAVLLARGGFRTTLQARTKEQAETLSTYRERGPDGRMMQYFGSLSYRF